MKTHLQILLLALFGSIGAALAQDQYNTNNTFATTNSIVAWSYWYGTDPYTISWDRTTDAAGNPASGSVKLQATFNPAQTNVQIAFQGSFSGVAGNAFGPTLDGSLYSYLDFDIMFAPSSPVGNGNYGSWLIGFYTGGQGPYNYGQITITNYTPLAGTTGWVHIHAPIDPTINGLGYITGFLVQAYQTDLTGTTTLWVDNILLTPAAAPPPPPILTLGKAQPGLFLGATVSSDENQRTELATAANNGYSWYNQASAANPVTYSMTITNYPDTNHPNFVSQIYWIPGSPSFVNNWAPDYVVPNALFLDIENQSDGSAFGRLLSKTNAPNSNGNFYDTGNLTGNVPSATPNGTWSVTFTNNTDGTVTTPDGHTQGFSMPPAVAALFADPLVVYFGDDPNDFATNIYQYEIVTDIQISGTPSTINDTFTAASLNTGTWANPSEDANGVQQIPASTAFILHWTLPDSGFSLQAVSTLPGGANWAAPNPALTIYSLGPLKNAIIPANTPAAGSGFFRLKK